MTFPSGSIQRGSLQWLRREVGMRMGYDPDPAVHTHEQRGRLDSTIESGLNRFYYPPPGEYNLANATDAQKERLRRAPHAWSFLQDVTTITTVDGTSEYSLPADFAAFIGEPTTANGTGRLAIVNEGMLRQLIDSAADEGSPTYAALRYSGTDGSTKPSAKIVLYPIPNAVLSIKVQHAISPPTLTTANPWPVAGVEHSEAILRCCFAEADERTGKDPGPAIQMMMAQLATSIMLDMQTAQATGEVWPDESVTQPEGKKYIEKMVGIKLGFGPNLSTMSTAERRKITEVYRSGLRRFLNPPVLPNEHVPHQWSFMRPTVSLSTVASTSRYDLPEDFTSFDGPLVWQDSSGLYRPIQVTSEIQLRTRIEGAARTGRPEIASVSFKETEGTGINRYQLSLWPTPDDAYTLRYRYRRSITPDS